MGRAKTLSFEIRDLIVKHYKDKNNSTEIAKKLNLSASSVRNIISIYRKRGNVKTAFKSKKPKITERDSRRLKKIVVANRRETSSGINCQWKLEISKQISTDTCKRTFKKMGYSFYKVTL